MVTGGSGWIGSQLVKYLKGKDYEVVNYDIKEGHDITNFDQLETFLKIENVDMIYHLAAQAFMKPGEENPRRDIDINIGGMLNLLKCLETYDVPMVYTSSGAVYGLSPSLPHREDMICTPVSNYGVSKLAAEKYLQKWVITKGIDAKIVRFSSVYGPYRNHGPVNIFINKAMKGETLTVYGTGAQTRDLTHFSDAIVGTELAMERGRRGEVYNIGLGEEHSVVEVAKIVKKYFNVPIEYVRHDMGPFDLSRSWYDLTKAKGLGYEPRMSLELGIGSTIFDMREGRE